jgi:hypothetical protein
LFSDEKAIKAIIKNLTESRLQKQKIHGKQKSQNKIKIKIEIDWKKREREKEHIGEITASEGEKRRKINMLMEAQVREKNLVSKRSSNGSIDGVKERR